MYFQAVCVGRAGETVYTRCIANTNTHHYQTPPPVHGQLLLHSTTASTLHYHLHAPLQPCPTTATPQYRHTPLPPHPTTATPHYCHAPLPTRPTTTTPPTTDTPHYNHAPHYRHTPLQPRPTSAMPHYNHAPLPPHPTLPLQCWCGPYWYTDCHSNHDGDDCGEGGDQRLQLCHEDESQQEPHGADRGGAVGTLLPLQ